MIVSKPAKVLTVEPIKVDEFSLLEKCFSLLLLNGSTLVYLWSKVQLTYVNCFNLEITLTLQNGKSYIYAFGDNVDYFKQVLKASVSSF